MIKETIFISTGVALIGSGIAGLVNGIELGQGHSIDNELLRHILNYGPVILGSVTGASLYAYVANEVSGVKPSEVVLSAATLGAASLITQATGLGIGYALIKLIQ
jgi:hypothetical protein